MLASERTTIPVWKNFRVVKTGIGTQSRRPCEAAMVSDDNDISDTSNSANFSCRQNISDGCMPLTDHSTPSGVTAPDRIGAVSALRDRQALSSRAGIGAPYA